MQPTARCGVFQSTALVRLYRHWPGVSTMDNVDAYVRRALLRTWLNERRRPWRREVSAGAAASGWDCPPATRAGGSRIRPGPATLIKKTEAEGRR